MIKAIITDNAHTYDLKNSLSARLVRTIKANGGFVISDDGARATMMVHAYSVDAEGKEVLKLIPSLCNVATYTQEETDTLFQSLNSDIVASGSFIDQINEMLYQILSIETTTNGMFESDTFTKYVPADV